MIAHSLSILLFLPLAGMFLIFALPERLRFIRLVAAGVGFITFLVSIVVVFQFDVHRAGFQLVERAPWIPSIGAQYLLGVDGISLLLILLTTLMTLVATVASFSTVRERPRLFYGMILLLQTGVLGVFLALDLFLFYLFWDLVLVPMYFIISLYGGPSRSYAAIKFFLYTLLGSVFLLLGFLALYFANGQTTGTYTFELQALMNAHLPLRTEEWIFWAFFLGFAVKVPMFPLHTWLPDAHVEAPTAGSVLLASLLLKMGTYGFLRFSVPLLPQATSAPGIVLIVQVLSCIAILYGALVCLTQRDWKKLVAYSSVSHMGFCTLGVFALNFNGITGSVIQQINHGISTGMLFLLVGFIYDRRHTREIGDYGGVARSMPLFAALFAITIFSSAGLPLLNGFIGEFTILAGAFAVNRIWALVGVLGLVLSASYLLWLYQRTMLGPIKYESNRSLPDLSWRERLLSFPLIALMFAIGIYPAPLFTVLRPAVRALVQQLHGGAAAGASLP